MGRSVKIEIEFQRKILEIYYLFTYINFTCILKNKSYSWTFDTEINFSSFKKNLLFEFSFKVFKIFGLSVFDEPSFNPRIEKG